MPLFEVTFDDVGFGCGKDALEELTPEQIAALNSKQLAKEPFPEGIEGILGATLSVDDSVHAGGADEDGDVKCFVSVRLLVEAEDADDAEGIDAPSGLLTMVAEELDPVVDIEGNWEVLDVTSHDPITPASAPSP